MKKYLSGLMVITIVILLLSSCSKTGTFGPQGTAGLQGPVGPAGPAGTNGQAGSVIYAGNTLPEASTGTNGDFYLDTATGLLYGPKVVADWGTGFSLAGTTGATGNTGATGATGAPGNTILSGTGIPDASLGKTGDFYLDKSSYLLYGPKTVSGWGSAASLQGKNSAISIEYSGWNYAINERDTTINNTRMSISDLPARGLTQKIIDGGVINVYVFIYGVYPLPFKYYVTGDAGQGAGSNYDIISFIPTTNNIILTRLNLTNNVGDPGNGFPAPVWQFRYVLIPGGTALAIKNNVDMKNYEAVRKYFRIKD